MYKRLFISILCLMPCLVQAQECGTEGYAPTAIESAINTWISQNKNKIAAKSLISIPVVVHIVYANDAENLPDSVIFSQIEVLNRDFRRRNSDTSATPLVWKGIAADFGINFCLATRDTNGNITNGITRTKTDQSFFINDDIKSAQTGGKNAWNTRKYLNIWVGNLGSVIGYAQYPWQYANMPQTDGVAIHFRAFGSIGTHLIERANKGRTTTHEIGHWLGLYHIFSGQNDCVNRDFVEDTPLQKYPSSGCPAFPLRDDCTFAGNGVMFMNFMDYTHDYCLNMFTNGQKERVLAQISLMRPYLYTLNTCTTSVVFSTENEKISIFPNPTEGGVKIATNDVFFSEITVLDMFGKTYLYIPLAVSQNNYFLDLSGMPKGLYFLKMKTNNGYFLKKIVLE